MSSREDKILAELGSNTLVLIDFAGHGSSRCRWLAAGSNGSNTSLPVGVLDCLERALTVVRAFRVCHKKLTF